MCIRDRYYVYRTAAGELAGLDGAGVEAAFNNMLGSAPTMTLWMVIAVVISFLVCVLGLKNGIEKVTKVMMSILIVLMVVLAVHSVFLPGAMEGVRSVSYTHLDVYKRQACTGLIMRKKGTEDWK